MIARFNKLRRTVSLLLATAWLCAGMMPAVVWATDPPPVQVAQAPLRRGAGPLRLRPHRQPRKPRRRCRSPTPT